MPSLLRIFLLLFVFILLNSSVLVSPTGIRSNTPKELLLYDSLNNYRLSKGLHAIPLSPKLSKVAQLHCKDLEKNYTLSKTCNLHSWSATSKIWSACCYTSDHKKASCMWDKPKEIAGYNSEGYEIAYYNSKGFDAYTPLESWIRSKKGHNMVIINEGQWRKIDWNSVGVGLSEHYACIWFGALPDTTSQ